MEKNQSQLHSWFQKTSQTGSPTSVLSHVATFHTSLSFLHKSMGMVFRCSHPHILEKKCCVCNTPFCHKHTLPIFWKKIALILSIHSTKGQSTKTFQSSSPFAAIFVRIFHEFSPITLSKRENNLILVVVE